MPGWLLPFQTRGLEAKEVRGDQLRVHAARGEAYSSSKKSASTRLIS
jgi:hypothetical protein